MDSIGISKACGRALTRAVLTAAAVLGGCAASMAQTVTYSQVQVNSLTSVAFDAAPDLLRDNTGADVQLGPVSGTHSAAFGSGSNFVVKPVTDAVFAKASLLNATLKTKALLQFGSNTFVSGSGVPLGASNGAASGTATFADSFRAYSGNKPFLWTSGTTATFQFSVTGTSSLTGTIPDPVDRSAGQPIDDVHTLLTVNVYKAGTLDLITQLQNFDFSAYPDSTTAFDAFLALANQIEANLIARNYWYFGDAITPYDIDPAHLLTLPATVQFDFAPGGDFDWVASLESSVFLDASLQNVAASLDFSNSIVTSYVGPAGTTTYSGSGLFPSTVALSQAPPPPCPSPQGFWKNNPDAWWVSTLTLGSQAYSKTELLALLANPGAGDASTILAVQLIATKLSLAAKSDPAPIAATVAASDTALAAFPGKLPYKVKTSSPAGTTMTQLAKTLDSYNNRLLTPSCTP